MISPLAALDPAIFVLLWFLFVGVCLACWLWALVDCLTGTFDGNDKLVWTLVIIFVPLVGAGLYFSIGRRQKRLAE